MQNPKQRQGWFSKLKNPFTSALAEHQQKLSGGSMSPDAKAKKIVPPKRQRGKYQEILLERDVPCVITKVVRSLSKTWKT